MRKIILFLLTALIACFPSAAAITPAQADSAYKVKNYTTAASLYKTCLQQAQTKGQGDEATLARLNYNLGNCYYRLKDYPRAVLHYQRALRIDPSDEDAAFNLQLTQAKLADRFDTPSEMFFVSWLNTLISGQSGNTWGQWSLGLLALAWVGFMAFYFVRPLWLRKGCFVLTVLFGISFLATQAFAYTQHHRYSNQQQAVVMQTTATFDSPTPSAKNARTLHEGTTITLHDSFKGGWIEIEMPDATTAWIKNEGIEKVAGN